VARPKKKKPLRLLRLDKNRLTRSIFLKQATSTKSSFSRKLLPKFQIKNRTLFQVSTKKKPNPEYRIQTIKKNVTKGIQHCSQSKTEKTSRASTKNKRKSPWR